MLKKWLDREIEKGKDWRQAQRSAYTSREQAENLTDSPLLGNPIAYLWYGPQKVLAGALMAIMLGCWFVIMLPFMVAAKIFQAIGLKDPFDKP